MNNEVMIVNKKNFIFTSDEETRDNLLKSGFSEIKSGGSFFVFVNNSTLKFDDSIDISKVGFTNKLVF